MRYFLHCKNMKQLPMKKILPLLLCLAFAARGSTQTPLPDSCRLRIGTNLSGPVDWGSEWPFVNIMKYARSWIAHNSQWVGGGLNAWDSELLGAIPLDAEGYPLELPYPVPGAESPQIVRTVWANTEALPEGNYVVLYDGAGMLDVWGDASLLSQTPGRLEFALQRKDNIFALELRQSAKNNHIRNIRVLLPGTEASYADNPFSAAWLEKLKPFQVLRFMDWGYTNNSSMRQWKDRTLPEDYAWTQKSGVPYEMWAALCERQHADAWVCVPHAASDDYIVKMAAYFRDNLDPDRKIYVEWSNEVWNWIFVQSHYGLDSLDQNLPWPERLGPRIAHVMQLWTDVFKGQEKRLVRVMSSQHAWWDLGERTFAQIEAEGHAGLIDAVSPAAYMGLDGNILDTWTAATGAQDVLDHAADFTFDPDEYAMQGWNAYAKLAKNKGKQLVFYEGGQHFTPNPFGSEQAYCQALIDCQTTPGMYNLYQRLFDTLRTFSNREMLFMNFSFISPLNCRYGSWGALQSQFDETFPYDNAPKYRAIVDAIAQYESCQGSVAVAEPLDPGRFQVYPNPAFESAVVAQVSTQSLIFRAELFDATGRLLRQFIPPAATRFDVQLSGLPAGSYVLRLVGPDFSEQKIMIKRG